MNLNYVKQNRCRDTLRLIFLFLCTQLLMMTAYGQTTVEGKVTSDDSPEGLPGVNVIVKGSITGTLTDFDGFYSIELPVDKSVLIFSFLGFKTQEVNVGTQSDIDISMIPDVSALDEVVVVG